MRGMPQTFETEPSVKRTYQPSRLVRKRRHGIPQAHADRRWPKGSRPSPREGPQAALGIGANIAGSGADIFWLEAEIPILPTLKARAEFLAVRGGRRSSTQAFLVEMRVRPDGAGRATGPRFGFTITKKVGNAVTRNRIRRRLKAAFAACAGKYASTSCDYVIVARHAAFDRPFALLLEDVMQAFASLHSAAGQRTAGRSAPSIAGDKKGSA